MPTLWLFDIEAHEQRYTSEWQTYLPAQLKAAAARRPARAWQVGVISGGATSGATTAGAFLDFAETNAYKSRQVEKFAKLVKSGKVKAGDRLLFADAWHPGVISARYMSDLLNLNLGIHVMWHSGSYDRFDQLGQKIRQKTWVRLFERSIYNAASQNYFATEYHRNLFLKNADRNPTRSRVVGWPMEYLPGLLAAQVSRPKDIILFPHRMAPEKQPKALVALAPLLTGYKIVFAQETLLTKGAYHNLLGRAVAVFSASRQETLGIGIYEGLLCGAVPIVPERLSYKEMYPGWCYDPEWSSSVSAAKRSKVVFSAHIRAAIRARDEQKILNLAQQVGARYFSGAKLYDSVLG